MGRVRRRSWQPPVEAVVSAVVLVVLATAAVTASTPARSAGDSGGLTRLLPPTDGETYFGFTFRLWETSDSAWGDARAFSDRIRDSVQFELAGKTPTFLTVWAPWQYPDQSGKPLVPFSNSSGDVSNVQGITGAHSLLYLDWTIINTTAQNGGITTKDIASGALDGISAHTRASSRASAIRC
jgi:hypothetical protein